MGWVAPRVLFATAIFAVGWIAGVRRRERRLTRREGRRLVFGLPEPEGRMIGDEFFYIMTPRLWNRLYALVPPRERS